MNKNGALVRLERLHQRLLALGFGSQIRQHECLAGFTSFGIGGPADLLVIAETISALESVVRLAWEEAVPLQVLGGGTNVLVADAGIRGLTVINRSLGYGMDEHGLMVARSGTPLCQIARDAVARGWGGLEWAVGVPGTIGGAVVGNAGAYGGSMADNVRWVEVLLPDGQRQRMDVEVLAYGYRTSVLKREHCQRHRRVVVEVAMQLVPADKDEIARQAEANTAQREARTPKGCCAGSIFKRTVQYPPGFLIEQAGLKGRCMGGAQVSPKHANFIMNANHATAADVRALVDLVQQEVLRAFGQELEPEIEFIGQWSRDRSVDPYSASSLGEAK